MAERKIEIQMATAGASEAASEIDKTSQAVAGLTEETEKHATAAKQDTQIGIDRANVLRGIAQAAGQAAQSIRGMADDVRDDAPEMAAKMDAVATAAGSLSGAMSGAAQGFALGGPFGAAVGALVGLLAGPLKSAFDDMMGSFAGAEASQNRLADSARKLQEALKGQANLEWLITAAENFDNAAAAAAKFAEDARRAKLAAASDREAAKAERDLADQEALNAGADPIQVGRARAQWDAQQGQAAITDRARGLVANATEAANVRDKAAEELRAAVASRGAKSDEATAAAKELDDAQKALAAALKEQLDFEAQIPGERLKIAAVEQAKLRSYDSQEESRTRAREREQSDMMERHYADNERLESAARRDAMEQSISAAGGQLNSFAGQAAGSFAAAARNARTPAARQSAAALGRIGESLADGTNEAEIKRLQQQFQAATQGMGGATVAALKQMLDAMTEQARKISVMQDQIKNLRKPGQ